MTSNSIYKEFIPTYLYIKQQIVTGKLYFGKTIQNPERYYGSGSHWVNHVRKHCGSSNVVNLWYHLFTDSEELISFAYSFPWKMNIVESTQWLNKKPENGLDDWVPGVKQSKDSNVKRGLSRKLRTEKLGYHHSKETLLKMKHPRDKQNNPRSKCKIVTCPNCGKSGGESGMLSWHFDNCQKNPLSTRTHKYI